MSEQTARAQFAAEHGDVEDLDQDLDVTEPEEDTSAYLVLDPDDDGAKFKCRKTIPRWQMMGLASAVRTGDEMKAMGAMYDFVHAIVLPEQHGALDEYMSEHDQAYDNLDDAIGSAMQAIVNPGRPTQRASHSSGSSTTTPLPSRVVSLSQGTVDGVKVV